VHALLGEVASSNSLAAAPIAQRRISHDLPKLQPTPSDPAGDYIFRVCFIDPFQGKVMAKFAKEALKAKTAAICADKAADYSVGLADVFVKEFQA